MLNASMGPDSNETESPAPLEPAFRWPLRAEFATNLRKERQAEGIAAAKARGVYKG
jgi:hypothetical protein